MNKLAIKEPERPKMEIRYEGFIGPKIDKAIIWIILLLYGLSICLSIYYTLRG